MGSRWIGHLAVDGERNARRLRVADGRSAVYYVTIPEIHQLAGFHAERVEVGASLRVAVAIRRKLGGGEDYCRWARGAAKGDDARRGHASA